LNLLGPQDLIDDAPPEGRGFISQGDPYRIRRVGLGIVEYADPLEELDERLSFQAEHSDLVWRSNHPLALAPMSQ